MKLLTKEIERKFEKHPLYSQDGKGLDAEVLVKYFDPCGAATWLITEARKCEDGDYEMFGYITLGYEWEWGYVMLSELQESGRSRLVGIERDLWVHNGATVRELVKE